METGTKTAITIKATVNAPVEKVWNFWNGPEHIIKWNSASPEWHTPRAEHDLKPGGKFLFRMEARDGSFGFDFSGVYDVVIPGKYLGYTLDDSRKVEVTFSGGKDTTDIVQTFEAEDENPVELQRGGWQAILDSFKNYTETTVRLSLTSQNKY